MAENKKIIADMHTHSENSHDSVCKIEEMCIAQIRTGISVMAVTDHFDTDSYMDYDVYTPIKNAYETVNALKEKYSDKCMLLTGVEISEGFWHPKECEKITAMLDYDVIIGSVHLVKYKNLTMAYSKIDFSALALDEVYAYLDAYFDDVLTMIEKTDFDVLAHLTCPVRYIQGKYDIHVDLSHYEEKIVKILKTIIEKNRALEVNTSSFDLLNDFMPTTKILRKYHDMGGYLLTIGSDAHVAENASVNFEKAIKTIKDIVFKHLYYYRNRKPVAYEI